ncbi:MAG: hypothetical protein ACXVA9_13945 [Bdellovibrionales bacterium]
MWIWLFLGSFSVAAAVIQNIPQIGAHYRILTLDKNENPQNILAIYTKLNPDCTMALDGPGKKPVLGYYWMMDHQNYKRVHPLILAGIRLRFVLKERKDPNSFGISFKDLKELESDIADHDIQVTSRRQGGECVLEARLRLGPSDSDQEIRLTSIHSESRKTFLPPFRRLTSVTLEGVDLNDGHVIHRKYSGN